MDGKIKLLALASIVAVTASGCSGYRGASQAPADAGSGGYSSGGGLYGQRTGTAQVARTGQVRGRGFGQQRSSAPAVCAPCGAAPKTQSNYTYKPATPAPKPKVQAGQHNQQYYIDRWNKQQKAQQGTGNYTGYGTAPSNTTYYDYSSAGKTAAANTNVAASNKSIYTGSYQQKTYKPYAPTTYAGGSAATTGTAAYANTAGTSSTASAGGGSTYVVKKGDTVFEIMRQTGVYWKDIISINNLTPPYSISPGQTIRLK